MLAINDIEFVKELYPRLRESDDAIERYRVALDNLPPIIVARGRVLVDGFHRWQAHRREGRTEIAAIDLGNLTDIEIRRESITRNATHGHQLSQADKQRLAGLLWRDLADSDNGTRKATIAGWLSVTERAVEMWTKNARANEKAEQQAKVWDLWLDCLDEREIGIQLQLPKTTVHDYLVEIRKASESDQAAPDSRQHFDIWTFQTSDGETGYFGAMPPQIVENLLWFYTEPGQIVFDPFAGSGTTIDVAKRMGRRVWASDRKPATPLLPIHEHDIVTGWPGDAPKRADFVLLDPPYWKQAAGRYSDDPNDLGNMTLDAFESAWAKVIKSCASHLVDGGRLAFIASPTYDGDGESDRVVDLATVMFQACYANGFDVCRRIIVPYQTQQSTGAQVVWARENRRMLMLYRDIVVMTR